MPYWKWAQEGISRQAVLPRTMHEAFEDMVQKVISGQVTRIHFNLDGISDPLASASLPNRAWKLSSARVCR